MYRGRILSEWESIRVKADFSSIISKIKLFKSTHKSDRFVESFTTTFRLPSARSHASSHRIHTKPL